MLFLIFEEVVDFADMVCLHRFGEGFWEGNATPRRHLSMADNLGAGVICPTGWFYPKPKWAAVRTLRTIRGKYDTPL